ncbi:MAG: hypothetical protein U0792_22950 [Gemmataceae bacterium]
MQIAEQMHGIGMIHLVENLPVDQFRLIKASLLVRLVALLRKACDMTTPMPGCEPGRVEHQTEQDRRPQFPECARSEQPG